MTLSCEQQARARYAGWRAASILTREPWATWLTQDKAPPPSLVIKAGGIDFSPEHADAAADIMVQAVRALLTNMQWNPQLLEKKLFAVGSQHWRVLQHGQLVAPLQPAGALRSIGGIFCVVGNAAGETLNAVGQRREETLPSSVAQLFRTWFREDQMAGKLDFFTKALCQGRSRLAEDWSAVLHLTMQEAPNWLTSTPQAAWQEMATALATVVGRGELNLDGWVTYSQVQIGRLLRGISEPNSKQKSRGGDEANKNPVAEFDRWLQERGMTDEELKDSGLRTIFTRSDWWSRTFAVERLCAYRKEHHDDNRDFASLAPVPHLGPDRRPPSPGLPVLDALWAVRALQECFPGRVARYADTPMQVVEVTLALRDATATEPRPESRDKRCVLLGQGTQDRNLRDFGRRLLQLVQSTHSSDPRRTQSYVCFRLRCSDGEEYELEVAFPWRHGIPTANAGARRAALHKDAKCFAEVATELEVIDGSMLGPDFTNKQKNLLHDLHELQGAWLAYPGIDGEDNVAEVAGLHTGPNVVWNIAERFIAAYNKVLDGFVTLFADAGDAAPRIAAGPLDRLLTFGIDSVMRQGIAEGTAVRVFGYHPLRLQRLIALEREALCEMERALETCGTLRDVPLATMTTLSGVPSVLWPLRGQQTDATTFFVPSEARADIDPWSQIYYPFAHPRSQEPDLIAPLRPLLNGLVRSVFPGMRRRMVIALDNASVTDRGLRPLLLVADAVNRDMDSRRLTEGIDLMVGDQLIGNDERAVPITVKGLEAVDTNTEDVARIITTLTSPRDEDPRLPLEMYPAPSPDAPLSVHIALMVRPWALRARWVVRQAPSKDSSLSTAMAWEPISQSWSALQLTEGNSLEQVFQELVIRRWRGEADTLRRALGQSLEAHDAHPLGKHMLEVHARAAEGALRVLIADPVFGAEAIDAVDSYQQAGLRVTMADYHRRTGWRITLLAKHNPNRECEATIRGLRRLFPDVSEELGRCIYEATHRALPAVTRHLWLLADQAEPDGELLGHLSVALFTSAVRRHISPQVPWSHGWHVLQKPFPQETILLSMDSLQHWTWTRRSGTRGDFIAICPSPENPDQEVWVVAIESKGSVGASLYDGRHQARIATDKLRERFHGANRRAERRELLRCLAEEAFRARANPRKTHDLVAQGHLVFRAACISTAVEGGDFQVEDEDKDVLWIRVQGLTGLMHLAGL